MSFQKGRYVTIDPHDSHALGICDRTGFVHNRRDLVPEMEYRGNALCWTGFYVGPDFVDVPNPQATNPVLPSDPEPVFDPRPQQNTFITWSQSYDIPWNETDAAHSPVGTWDDWNGAIDGTPAVTRQAAYDSLKTGIKATVPIIPGYIDPPEQLTQAEVRASLQNVHWG